MDSQQGPIVWHMELCSMLCTSLDGRRVWRRIGTCICMAESLCCSPGITATLLIGYTPIQNKKFTGKKNIHHGKAKLKKLKLEHRLLLNLPMILATLILSTAKMLLIIQNLVKNIIDFN